MAQAGMQPDPARVFVHRYGTERCRGHKTQCWARVACPPVCPPSAPPEKIKGDHLSAETASPEGLDALAGPAGPAGLRLMAVHAHPDDESSKGAATMARYVAEDVEVLVVTCTGGERGSILNPAMDRPEVKADIAGVREREMDRAREILGVRQSWLGFIDSGFPPGDPLPPLPDGCFAVQSLEAATEPLVRAVRELRPHLALTYDETGGYPHP